jgi:hypothetical protein
MRATKKQINKKYEFLELKWKPHYMILKERKNLK